MTVRDIDEQVGYKINILCNSVVDTTKKLWFAFALHTILLPKYVHTSKCIELNQNEGK